MARHAIIDKLHRELREPINTERQVVYLLIEIRKLAEINGDKASLPSLRFACDWVAHTVLTGPQAKDIVRLIDKYQQQIEALNNVRSGTKVDATCLQEAGEILKLSKFRTELGKYLSHHGLDSTITGDDAKWANL